MRDESRGKRRMSTSRRKGFTLIELLNTIAIIAILTAMFAPVIASVRGALGKAQATRSLAQLGSACRMYMADHDDTFPLAMYRERDGRWRAWFGLQEDENRFDPEGGLLRPYLRGRVSPDPTHRARPYLGDMSGFGYNYAYLGSDFGIRRDFSRFPDCQNPATGSMLADPSNTVVFATSSFYRARWLDHGDGQTYDFGFVDAPRFWHGNPNVDFRHGEPKVVDESRRTVHMRGHAVFVFADGRARTLRITQVNDAMFERERDPFASALGD